MQTAHTALSTLKPGYLADHQPAPAAWIGRVFDRLSAQFGARLADLYAGVPPEHVRDEWADALADFHSSEIARGLKACQSRQFAPNLGEFLRMCRPALDPEVAWLEAYYGMRSRAHGDVGEWSHPAVYRAAAQFQFELRSGQFRDHRKAWTWLLEREFAAGWGHEVPAPLVQIGHTRQPKAAPPCPEKQAA